MNANANKKRKKLELKRETLRHLTAKEASAVRGGIPLIPTDTGPLPNGSGEMKCLTINCVFDTL